MLFTASCYFNKVYESKIYNLIYLETVVVTINFNKNFCNNKSIIEKIRQLKLKLKNNDNIHIK